MKLQQYLLLSVMLFISSTIHSSDFEADLTSATAELNQAYQSLAQLLGVSVDTNDAQDTQLNNQNPDAGNNDSGSSLGASLGSDLGDGTTPTNLQDANNLVADNGSDADQNTTGNDQNIPPATFDINGADASQQPDTTGTNSDANNDQQSGANNLVTDNDSDANQNSASNDQNIPPVTVDNNGADASQQPDTTGTNSDASNDQQNDINQANPNPDTPGQVSGNDDNQSDVQSQPTPPVDTTPTIPQDNPVETNQPVVKTLAPLNTTTPTMITNNTTQSVYLVFNDSNSQQINVANIAVAAGELSYIPSNVATVKVVDDKNSQLIAATAIQQNNAYSISNLNKTWKMSAIAAPKTFAYTNDTTIPLTISITVDDTVYNEQVGPNIVYNQELDPTKNIVVTVHANLAGIAAAYNPTLAYDISLNIQDQLALTQTTDTDKRLTNNCGWPLLATMYLSNGSKEYMRLDDNEYCNPSDKTTKISLTPLIINLTSAQALAKSYTIINKNGQLAFK